MSDATPQITTDVLQAFAEHVSGVGNWLAEVDQLPNQATIEVRASAWDRRRGPKDLRITHRNEYDELVVEDLDGDVALRQFAVPLHQIAEDPTSGAGAAIDGFAGALTEDPR